jgi:hypothetical protein
MQAADLMPSCLPFDILADDAPVIGETMAIRRPIWTNSQIRYLKPARPTTIG